MVLYEYDLANPDFGGYLKAGRFTPTYGLRLPNHSLFIREDIGFGPADKDVGLEAGFRLGPVLLQAGVMSGVGQERALDDNAEKALVGRVEWLWGPLAALNMRTPDIGAVFPCAMAQFREMLCRA